MFYDIIMTLCKDKGVKLTPLLKELNLSESGIARWRGGSLPNGKTLALLAGYFGVTTDFLLGSEALCASDEIKLDELQFALYKETEDWNLGTLQRSVSSSILTENDKRDILEFARYIREKRRKEGRKVTGWNLLRFREQPNAIMDYAFAMCLCLGEDDFAIAVNTGHIMTAASEKAIFAHELGHCATDRFYNINMSVLTRGKCERRAGGMNSPSSIGTRRVPRGQ